MQSMKMKTTMRMAMPMIHIMMIMTMLPGLAGSEEMVGFCPIILLAI